MRLGTKLYHFNSGPPIRHDRTAGPYGNHFPALEVAFIEESVSGPTLSDLLEKLPVGWKIQRLSEGGNWLLEAPDGVEIGDNLPALLRRVGRD